MVHNSRLAVCVHLLAYLTHKAGQPVTSQELAASVDTNPVVIRRLLSTLRRAGLVTAQKGAAGGFALGRPAASVTLLDVYRATEPGAALGLDRFAPNTDCPVGARIGALLHDAFVKAQSGMEAELARITIASIEENLRGECPEAARARAARAAATP